MKYDFKTGCIKIDYTDIDNALHFVEQQNYRTRSNQAVYIGPHFSNREKENFLKQNPRMQTLWDTNAGKAIKEKGWFDKNSPFSLKDQKRLYRAMLKNFFEKAIGNFTIVGLDPKTASVASHQFYWLYEALHDAKTVRTINKTSKFEYFLRFYENMDGSPRHPYYISADKRQVIKPNPKTWERGYYIRHKRNKPAPQ